MGLQKVALFCTLKKLKLYKEVETKTYVWFKIRIIIKLSNVRIYWVSFCQRLESYNNLSAIYRYLKMSACFGTPCIIPLPAPYRKYNDFKSLPPLLCTSLANNSHLFNSLKYFNGNSHQIIYLQVAIIGIVNVCVIRPVLIIGCGICIINVIWSISGINIKYQD